MISLGISALGFTTGPLKAAAPARASGVSMGVGLIYSTSTGNTETVAGYLAAASGLEAVMIDDLSGEDVAGYDGFIIGAPTWNTGADTERSGTAWDEFLYGDLAGLDLKGKKVAVFAVGDQAGYADNFCDAMDELHSCFTGQGAEAIGMVANDGYEHEESKSVRGDKFLGMPFDEDNQPEMSEDRAKAWIAQLKSEGMPL